MSTADIATRFIVGEQTAKTTRAASGQNSTSAGRQGGGDERWARRHRPAAEVSLTWTEARMIQAVRSGTA